jgi:hypothetical protein
LAKPQVPMLLAVGSVEGQKKGAGPIGAATMLRMVSAGRPLCGKKIAPVPFFRPIPNPLAGGYNERHGRQGTSVRGLNANLNTPSRLARPEFRRMIAV